MLELGIGAGALEVVCLGAHPDDIEYPLPGSDATCDACGYFDLVC